MKPQPLQGRRAASASDNMVAPWGLMALADRFGSDKGLKHFERHGYARVYEALFAPLRDKPLRILEIGLLHSQDARWVDHPWENLGRARAMAAPSLEMWAAYFPRAVIFGFDINDFSAVSIPRTRIIQGDMGAAEDLDRLVQTTGGAFDIIIDDASHCSHHQQFALARLFPELTAGGSYVIEDLHWQNPLWEPSDAVKTRDVLKGLERGQPHSTSKNLPDAAQTWLNGELAELLLFDSLEPGATLEARDALAVLRRKRA